MIRASLGAVFDRALATYHQAHGVVSYFAYEAHGARGEELHDAATLAAFEALRAELETARFRLTLERAKMRTKPIGVKEFLGAPRVGDTPALCVREVVASSDRVANAISWFWSGRREPMTTCENILKTSNEK